MEDRHSVETEQVVRFLIVLVLNGSLFRQRNSRVLLGEPICDIVCWTVNRASQARRGLTHPEQP